MEMSSVMSSIRENQVELMEEVKSLRKENQQLQQIALRRLSVTCLFPTLLLLSGCLFTYKFANMAYFIGL
ncbi:protein NEDD1 [Quillaja saponaria]|nr:protein NEDD1 [Quillaja saponaria]